MFPKFKVFAGYWHNIINSYLFVSIGSPLFLDLFSKANFIYMYLDVNTLDVSTSKKSVYKTDVDLRTRMIGQRCPIFNFSQ